MTSYNGYYCKSCKTHFYIKITITSKGIKEITLSVKNVKKSLNKAKNNLNSHLNKVKDLKNVFLKQTLNYLNQYFKGKSMSAKLPFDLSDSTSFQQKVWNATQKIPYGQTRSYLWIAKR